MIWKVKIWYRCNLSLSRFKLQMSRIHKMHGKLPTERAYETSNLMHALNENRTQSYKNGYVGVNNAVHVHVCRFFESLGLRAAILCWSASEVLANSR